MNYPNNPFTLKEVMNDLGLLVHTDFTGFYFKPLGQLYMGFQTTESAFANLCFIKTVDATNAQNLNLLDRIDITPLRCIEFLLQRKELVIADGTNTGKKGFLAQLQNKKTAFVAGCIKPASLNGLTKMLSKIGFRGTLTVVEKNEDVFRMLNLNTELHEGVGVKIVLGDALEITDEYDVIFCDVLGRYLSDTDFTTKLPGMLNKLNPDGLAFVADMEQYAEVKERFTLTQGLGKKLNQQEREFLKWINTTLKIKMSENDVIKLRNNLFEPKNANTYNTKLIDLYTRLLPNLKLKRNVSVTSVGYLDEVDGKYLASRYFDYMLFQKAA